MTLLSDERRLFHKTLVDRGVLTLNAQGVASIADSSQRTSKIIALTIASRMQARTAEKLPGQRAGAVFEEAVGTFLTCTFPYLQHIRPGKWCVENLGGKRGDYQLSAYEPYTHLKALSRAVETDPTLQAVLGHSYLISPDVLVIRDPEDDDAINSNALIVDLETARHTVMRSANDGASIVHAVISCKLTLRSDRAQNARSEALSVIRNRKGRTPHIVVVTAEPSPSRIASLALGTGDIDMVYHIALPELMEGVQAAASEEGASLLEALIEGRRLRDIADLPLDLCV